MPSGRSRVSTKNTPIVEQSSSNFRLDESARVTIQQSQRSLNLEAGNRHSFVGNRDVAIMPISVPYDFSALNCFVNIATIVLSVVSTAIRVNYDDNARWYFLGSAAATVLAGLIVWICSLVRKNNRGCNSAIMVSGCIVFGFATAVNLNDDLADYLADNL